jgi:asparagine synthase (glutamine-hydrolysing)
MCGIAGILDFRGRPVLDEELRKVVAAIRHRGPDDAGVWTRENVGLGNARLAILDLSAAGHQPMLSDDGQTALVYNGELYNFRELSSQLERAGCVFRSRSDTEVVLRAYETWGPDCVERFNGMFAFAIWDERNKMLFAARDRFGIKPFYYGRWDERFLFGSEIKALIAAGLKPRVSHLALNEYFTFQNILSDLTLFEGVRLLPPGHTLTVRDGRVAQEQYWDLVFDPDESVSEADWVGGLRETFRASVSRQLISDVPIGGYLSGGMDSASIIAAATREIPRMMTFTGGFDLSSVSGLELVFDERADAEAVASEFRTEHYEMVMHAGDMSWVMPELVWHLEDLRLGMAYQNHYIARLASKFVKVCLGGAGGDELFAGYPWRYALIEDARSTDDFDRKYYAYWSRLLGDAEKATFFAPSVWNEIRSHATFDVYRSVMSGTASSDPIDKALYFEAKTFLHGLLIVEDKLSMAHGLEDRVPFLDNEMADIARRIPSSLKHSQGVGKRVLREAMRDLLPAEITAKRKQGFSPPDGSWYRGPTMDYIREILLDPRSLERGYFEPYSVVRILEEHLHGKVNHRLLIWSLLCFEWWNRLFIDGETPSRHGAWHEASTARVPGR